MIIKLEEERENIFLDRRELIFSIKHDGGSTPSRREVFNHIVKEYSLKPENTLLMWVKTERGKNISRALVYYYPNGIDWSTIRPNIRKRVIFVGEEESKEEG